MYLCVSLCMIVHAYMCMVVHVYRCVVVHVHNTCPDICMALGISFCVAWHAGYKATVLSCYFYALHRPACSTAKLC